MYNIFYTKFTIITHNILYLMINLSNNLIFFKLYLIHLDQILIVKLIKKNLTINYSSLPFK